MAIWEDQLATSTGVATAETALTAYTPTKSGTLIAIKVWAGYTAATSVVYNGHIRLQSAQFGGVDEVIEFYGPGLATVPAFPPAETVQPVNMPAQAGIPINIKYMYESTPTTPFLGIYGVFQG